jgi:hypothetical protein
MPEPLTLRIGEITLTGTPPADPQALRCALEAALGDMASRIAERFAGGGARQAEIVLPDLVIRAPETGAALAGDEVRRLVGEIEARVMAELESAR